MIGTNVAWAQEYRFTTNLNLHIQNPSSGYSGTLPITAIFTNCVGSVYMLINYNRSSFVPTHYTYEGVKYPIQQIKHLDPRPDVECVTFNAEVIHWGSVCFQKKLSCVMEGTSCYDLGYVIAEAKDAEPYFKDFFFTLRSVEADNITRRDYKLEGKLREMKEAKKRDLEAKKKEEEASEKKNKDDEFWSGEKEKEVTNKKDDSEFWDGGTAKQENNKETDFWEGKGTSEEERKFTENTKPDESDQFIGNVRSRTGKVRIFCVDTGQEDGDLVRIINNGATLMDNIYLTNAGKSYWFDLQFGQNNIEILALNQGTTGANTAAFKVFDDKGALIAEKGWHLYTGYKGKLLILKI